LIYPKQNPDSINIGIYTSQDLIIDHMDTRGTDLKLEKKRNRSYLIYHYAVLSLWQGHDSYTGKWRLYPDITINGLQL